jgi:hypothetical protein
LRRQSVRIRHIQPGQRLAQPQPPLLLEIDGDPVGVAARPAQLGNRIDERTAAELLACRPGFDPVEPTKDLFDGRPVLRRYTRNLSIMAAPSSVCMVVA